MDFGLTEAPAPKQALNLAMPMNRTGQGQGMKMGMPKMGGLNL